MVLLASENHLNIKNNHILKCLEKKKNTFNVFVVPLKNDSNGFYTIKEDDKKLGCLMENLSDDDITILSKSFDKK